MTKKTRYDGTGKIAEAIAALYGLSPKSKNQISVKIREAKDGLGAVILILSKMLFHKILRNCKAKNLPK